MTRPIITSTDQHDTTPKPAMPWRPLVYGALFAGVLWLVIIGGAWIATSNARPAQIQPVRAPAELLRARAACPNTATPVECRSALRRAYAAVRWQRHARWQAKATTAQEVTRDAIRWAAQKYGHGATGKRALERQMLGIGLCESNLWLWATNGQFLSWAQLSSRHRSDRVITRLTWRDPYAVADHVARYLLAHGEGEWQCRSTGGLRW